MTTNSKHLQHVDRSTTDSNNVGCDTSHSDGTITPDTPAEAAFGAALTELSEQGTLWTVLRGPRAPGLPHRLGPPIQVLCATIDLSEATSVFEQARSALSRAPSPCGVMLLGSKVVDSAWAYSPATFPVLEPAQGRPHEEEEEIEAALPPLDLDTLPSLGEEDEGAEENTIPRGTQPFLPVAQRPGAGRPLGLVTVQADSWRPSLSAVPPEGVHHG